MQKVMARRNDEQDLLEARDFIVMCERIQKTVLDAIERGVSEKEEATARRIADSFKPLRGLAQELEDAIDESVMDKRRQMQDASAEEVEATVVRTELRNTQEDHGEIEAEPPQRRSRGKGKTDQDEQLSKFWGPPLEHLIRPG